MAAPLDLVRGRYHAFLARDDDDIAAAQTLRATCFGLALPRDTDRFDPEHQHVLIHDLRDARLVCCFRLRVLDGDELPQSYAAQYYAMERLEAFAGRLMELGRFCVLPGHADPDIIRTAWAALTQMVDDHDIKLLFGCSSFAGTDAGCYRDTFGLMNTRHLGPERWRPGMKAPQTVLFAEDAAQGPDLRAAMLHMPPLLRTYLMMGGWVSDHAVIDRQMNTLHVFTGLEIDAIPEGRKRLLRGLV
jgi:L-ornithine Nalpha-acyltransferase